MNLQTSFRLATVFGVVMTSIHRKLTFGTYVRIMTLPSFLAFVGGMAALYVQYLVLHT